MLQGRSQCRKGLISVVMAKKESLERLFHLCYVMGDSFIIMFDGFATALKETFRVLGIC